MTPVDSPLTDAAPVKRFSRVSILICVVLVALVWIALITVLFVLPPNELTGYIFAGTIVVMFAFYFLRVRGKFRGPVAQARSPDELLKIETELEE